MDCERLMRFAQSGGLADAVAEVGEGEASAVSPPTVPMVEEPPVVSKLDLAPSEKLDLTLSLARAAARFRGDTAALPAALATPPIPAATLDAPD